MKLTARDKEFLHDLYNVKYLNSRRICKLFTNYKSCMRRLKQLTDNNFIKIVDLFYNGEYVYTITKKTCGFLGLEDISVTKTGKLLHAMACADFYFYVKPKGINNIHLENQYYFTHNHKKYTFRPDILVEIDRYYLVEIDLSNRRFEKKIKTWEVFYQSAAYKQYFEKYPPIIIVSTNVKKVQKIIENNKKIELNYVYKNYKEVGGWLYKYSK